MKIVYIAHPIGGNVEENLADLRRIIRLINIYEPTVVPLAPYYADVVTLDDNNPVERSRGIKNGVAVLESGIIKELWLTGPHISAGMKSESDLAKVLGIPVVDYIGSL